LQRIGVSPAFVISAATGAFLATDYLSAIRRVAGLGFSAIQLEVFRPEAVEEWTPAVTAQVRALLEAEGLLPTQFIAHFLLHDFQSTHALSQRGGFNSFQRFLEVAAAFPRCPVITIPMPPFECRQNCDQPFLRETRTPLVDYLGQLLELTGKAGKRLALEVMPYSLIGGTEGFLRLKGEAGLESLAYNFDTGHAWARKEPVALIPALLGDAIVGTHLCDNQANESLKWRPGTGSIDFVTLLENLAVAGYQGSLDLEILCPPYAIDREYAAGRSFVETLVGSRRITVA
jgi:sugar phosphate isomerase/epimerase